MTSFKLLLLLVVSLGYCTGTPEDLVASITQGCSEGDQPLMRCLREKVLDFVNTNLGEKDGVEGRGMSDENIDELITSRVAKYVNQHDFKVQLPEFLFQKATLTLRAGKALSDFTVQFPEEPKGEERAISKARDILKKKLLLPILLLLKLKIKALTPILLILVGIKAFKAFVMSKISLLLVIGFLIVQLCKKAGMPMPAAMMSTEPPVIYGPAPTPAPYGAPTPDNSYGPWEPSSSGGSGGPYARWDSHNVAYNSYQPEPASKTSQQLKPGA